MLLHTLECIVNVEDGCCASLALNMHQMGYFTLLRIFILELFLTRENMRRRRRKKPRIITTTQKWTHFSLSLDLGM